MYHPRNQLTGPLWLPFPIRPLKCCWYHAGMGTAHGPPTEAARALNSNRGQEGTYCSDQVCQLFMVCQSKITGRQGHCRSLLSWIRRLFAGTMAMDILIQTHYTIWGSGLYHFSKRWYPSRFSVFLASFPAMPLTE
jgi:hypothetical protein